MQDERREVAVCMSGLGLAPGRVERRGGKEEWEAIIKVRIILAFECMFHKDCSLEASQICIQGSTKEVVICLTLKVMRTIFDFCLHASLRT